MDSNPIDTKIEDIKKQIEETKDFIETAKTDENLAEMLPETEQKLEALMKDLSLLEKEKAGKGGADAGGDKQIGSGSKNPFTIVQKTVTEEQMKVEEEAEVAKKADTGKESDSSDDNFQAQDIYQLNGDDSEENPELITEVKLGKREANKDTLFPFYRNLYFGTIENVDDCQLSYFQDKQCQSKCNVPINNAIFIQTAMEDLSNYSIEQTAPTSAKINNAAVLELAVGNVLEMDGTVVGQLCEKQPTPEMVEHLPNWEADYKKLHEKTEEEILDGGVIPCSHKGNLANAEKLLVVQSSKEPDLKVGVASVLNILDAAEVMSAGTVSIPELTSFANNDDMALHMVYHTVEFMHTLQDDKKLAKVRLVAKNEEVQTLMSNHLAQIVAARKA